MRAKFLVSAAAAATCVNAFALAGDWTVTLLEVQPASQGLARVNAIWGDRQGGSIDPGLQQPTIWLSTPNSGFQAVLPTSADGGQIVGLTPTSAVGDGFAPDFGGYILMVWNQDGSSVNVIQPPQGFTAAFASGAGGTQQVGTVEDFNNGRRHPALWSGTTASFVDLLPSGFESGRAYASDGTRQVGEVAAPPDFFTNAALWSGSAGSFINLQPGAPWTNSEAYDISGATQVGYVADDDGFYAAAWQGTAASMFLLHPSHVPAALESEALAIFGTVACGYTGEFTGQFTETRAAAWTSLNPLSYVNLHELLGEGYANSDATDVWVDDDGVIKVVGNAELAISSDKAVVLWTLDPCAFALRAPASAASLVGDLNGDLVADSCQPLAPEDDCNTNGLRDADETLVFTNETFTQGAGPWSINSAAAVGDGSIVLTPSTGSLAGTAIRPPLTAGPTQRLRAIFDFRIDQHVGVPADGFSFVLFDSTTIGTNVIFGEDGITAPGSITIKFNTYENFPGEGSDSMFVLYEGNVIASNTNLPFVITDENWHRAIVDLSPDGRVSVSLATNAGNIQPVFTDVQLPNYQPLRHNLGFGARTGGFASRHSIANVRLAVNGPNDLDGNAIPDSCAPLCAPCAADYDNNGGVDGGDLAAFFTDFEAGEACADVDLNGGVDGGDLATFFTLFELGGC